MIDISEGEHYDSKNFYCRFISDLITLNRLRAASDLVAMLPLELTLIERNSFAKGMTLPEQLSLEEASTREYEIGDFGYWNAGTVKLKLLTEERKTENE